jgi:hypothetical protein
VCHARLSQMLSQVSRLSQRAPQALQQALQALQQALHRVLATAAYAPPGRRRSAPAALRREGTVSPTPRPAAAGDMPPPTARRSRPGRPRPSPTPSAFLPRPGRPLPCPALPCPAMPLRCLRCLCDASAMLSRCSCAAPAAGASSRRLSGRVGARRRPTDGGRLSGAALRAGREPTPFPLAPYARALSALRVRYVPRYVRPRRPAIAPAIGAPGAGHCAGSPPETPRLRAGGHQGKGPILASASQNRPSALRCRRSAPRRPAIAPAICPREGRFWLAEAQADRRGRLHIDYSILCMVC